VNNYLNKLFSLENKICIVTGAAGYFGKMFSECLLLAGAKIILFGRGNKIESLAKVFKEKYGKYKVDFYILDFYDTNNYEYYLKQAVKNNKSIDVLVNNSYDFSKNTGFNDQSGRIENMSKKQWMLSLASGIYWSALSTQIIGEQMKYQRSGSIINISSMYAIVSPDLKLYEGVETFNPPSYSASKAAILALTRYTASFYGKYNIRCNAILPGAFPNIGTDSYNAVDNNMFLKRVSNKTVLNRYGKPDDLKGVLLLLSSDASSYITGQSIVVDGGWTIT